MSPRVQFVRETAKAFVAMIVCAAAYLAGVVPAEGGFGDVSTVQWLGLVVFMGGAYGITYGVPNARAAVKRRDETGAVSLDEFARFVSLFEQRQRIAKAVSAGARRGVEMGRAEGRRSQS